MNVTIINQCSFFRKFLSKGMKWMHFIRPRRGIIGAKILGKMKRPEGEKNA